MKEQDLTGLITTMISSIRLRYPNCIVLFQVEHLENEKQFIIYGEDAALFSKKYGTVLRTGEDIETGQCTRMPGFAESLIYIYAAELNRTCYMFTDLTPRQSIAQPEIFSHN